MKTPRRKKDILVLNTCELVLDCDLRLMPPEAYGIYIRLMIWADRSGGSLPNEPEVLMRLAGVVTKGEMDRFAVYWDEHISGMFDLDKEERLWLKPTDYLVGSKPTRREPIGLDIRRRILAAGKCAYCEATENLVVDHIRPVKHGGSSHIRNLQCLCWKCNSKKRDKWSGRMKGQTLEFILNA